MHQRMGLPEPDHPRIRRGRLGNSMIHRFSPDGAIAVARSVGGGGRWAGDSCRHDAKRSARPSYRDSRLMSPGWVANQSNLFVGGGHVNVQQRTLCQLKRRFHEPVQQLGTWVDDVAGCRPRFTGAS